MKTLGWITCLLLMLGAAYTTSTAQEKPDWGQKFPNYELLGERQVDFGADNDTIMVTGKEGRYVSLMIGVMKGNVEMYDIKVTFGNDESWSPEVKHEFKQGSRSRQLDLPGEARVIRKVEFKYKSKIRKGKATVKLFGKPADAGADNGGDKPAPGKEWMERLPNSADGYHFLGKREVSFIADRDTIEVTAREGKFVGIVIGVDEGELEMWDINIEFGNGETHSPELRANFGEKTRSRVIDLPGDARNIKKVTFMYKSKLKKGKATVKLYGKPAPVEDRYAGCTHLGTKKVDFAKDTDILVLGADEGKFKGMLIEVEDGDLHMHDITVTFGNGKQFSPETRLQFNEESRSRVIDFPGDARVIGRIAFKYRSDKPREGKATINVYGRE